MNLNKIYELFEGLFYDSAISSNKNEYWFCNLFNLITVEDTGTKIEETSDSRINYFISTVQHSTTWGDRRKLALPLCIEVDVVNYSYGIVFMMNQTDANTQNLGLNRVGHWKIEITENEIIPYFNDEQQSTVSHNFTDDIMIGFQSFGDQILGKLTFKNFVVYSLE